MRPMKILATLLLALLIQSKDFTVPPTNKKAKYGRARATEKMKISGEIKIIPLMGATVVLSTPNLGEIIIGKLLAMPEDVSSRFEALNDNHYSVDATGTVVTVCTEKKIKKAKAAGCRLFDESKPIRFHQW